jgi:hypothetical protein
MVAAFGGHHDIVNLLVTYKANINTTTLNGITVLRVAQCKAHTIPSDIRYTTIIELLQNAGAQA